MNKENILKEVSDTFASLKHGIGLFDGSSFNHIPFEGSWTPGQVAEHLIITSGGFAQVLNAEVATTERKIDEWVPQIKADFLDFSTKMKSPGVR